MLNWNRIPLPIERPEVPQLEQSDLEECIADYTASLLSRWGDIELTPASEATPDPLYTLELPQVVLTTGNAFRIGQLPMIEGRVVTEPQSFSLTAPAVGSYEPFMVAVRESCAGTDDYLVDHEGCRLDYEDTLELAAALRVIWTSFSNDVSENEVRHNLSIFPHVQGKSWLDPDASPMCSGTSLVEFCIPHQDGNESAYRPRSLFLPEGSNG